MSTSPLATMFRIVSIDVFRVRPEDLEVSLLAYVSDDSPVLFATLEEAIRKTVDLEVPENFQIGIVETATGRLIFTESDGFNAPEVDPPRGECTCPNCGANLAEDDSIVYTESYSARYYRHAPDSVIELRYDDNTIESEARCRACLYILEEHEDIEAW